MTVGLAGNGFGAYQQGIQFTEAMLRGLTVRNDDGARIVPIPAAFASGAFAVELILKALLYGAGTPSRGHRLLRLYRALDSNAQGHLCRGYARFTGDPAILAEMKLSVMSDAFQAWRYSYEDPSLVHGTDPFALSGLIYGAAITYRIMGYAPREASRAEASTMRWLMKTSPLFQPSAET